MRLHDPLSPISPSTAMPGEFTYTQLQIHEKWMHPATVGCDGRSAANAQHTISHPHENDLHIGFGGHESKWKKFGAHLLK